MEHFGMNMEDYHEHVGDWQSELDQVWDRLAEGTWVSLEICVYPKEEERDYYKNRHVGLYFKFCEPRQDNEETVKVGLLAHATNMKDPGDGSHVLCDGDGNFVRFHFVLDQVFPFDPSGSSRLERGGRVNLGWLHNNPTKEDITSAMDRVPILETLDDEFNCQIWVGWALDELAKCGYMTKKEVENAVGLMVDIIARAEAEEYAE